MLHKGYDLLLKYNFLQVLDLLKFTSLLLDDYLHYYYTCVIRNSKCKFLEGYT